MNCESLHPFKYKFNLLQIDRKYISDLKLDVDKLFGDNWYLQKLINKVWYLCSNVMDKKKGDVVRYRKAREVPQVTVMENIKKGGLYKCLITVRV